MPKEEGGLKGVTYPLVADLNKTVSTNYDVLAGEYDYDEEGNLLAHGNLVAYRGLFLIDKEGIVRHQLVNFFPIGRSVDEAIRVLDAWIHNETHGEVCPANWEKGKEAMSRDNVRCCRVLGQPLIPILRMKKPRLERVGAFLWSM